MEAGRRTVVGVNKFQTEEPPAEGIFRLDAAVAQRQIDRLSRVRAQRDGPRVQALLARLEETARSDANLIPVFIECVENYVTLGEICSVLRNVFGEQREFMVF
jgi:methylmalonyl-CoA mutase N-terminal domain/subunit